MTPVEAAGRVERGAGGDEEQRDVGARGPRLRDGREQRVAVGEPVGDEQDQDGVGLAGLEHVTQRGRELPGRDVGPEVDRVADVDRAGDRRAQGGAQLVGGRGDDHALEVGAVGRERAHAARVGDDAHPEPGRERLLHEQQRGLGQLGAGPAGDHPGLVEQRVDADTDGGGDGRVLTGPGPASDHGQQRLLLGEAASGAGELEGVAERLQVERAGRDPVVVHPRGQQVVAGHVDLVAQRDEGLHAEAHVAGEVEEREAHAPGLGGDRQAADLRARRGAASR